MTGERESLPTREHGVRLITDAKIMRDHADRIMLNAVWAGRASGLTWRECGALMGISGPGAHQWANKHRPAEFDHVSQVSE